MNVTSSLAQLEQLEQHIRYKRISDVLINRPDEGIVEEIKIYYKRTLFVYNTVGNKELVGCFSENEHIDWFETTRKQIKENQPQTPWDESCFRRITRSNRILGDYFMIEPGIVWFVEWIEKHKGKTVFSCEGHPEGFYIDFTGPLKIYRMIILCGGKLTKIKYLSSGMYAIRLELLQTPQCRNERDEMLRTFSSKLIEMTTREQKG